MHEMIEEIEQFLADLKIAIIDSRKKDEQIAELEAALKIERLKKDDDFLTVNQVADFIGLSKHTIYKKAEHKSIPFYRIGGLLRFKKSELLEWIDSRHEKISLAKR